eukprot:COSAG04_NODE_1502_length_6513_cov_4.361241_2_plen_97_part_00
MAARYEVGDLNVARQYIVIFCFSLIKAGLLFCFLEQLSCFPLRHFSHVGGSLVRREHIRLLSLVLSLHLLNPSQLGVGGIVLLRISLEREAVWLWL